MLKNALDSNIELVVYSVLSPERGPGHRVYTEEDIQASGGIHAIEGNLEKESYWFVRLGVILGEADPQGVRYSDAEFSKLAISPPPEAWQIGRRNPGFRRSELDRRVFKATFEAIERFLKSWNSQHDGVVDAYTLKELKISSECLLALTNGLHNLRRVHDIAGVTVMKYWYEAAEPEPHEPDLLLAEYSLDVPFRVQWSVGKEIVDVQVLPLSLC